MLRIYYADVSALPENPEGLPLSRYRLEQLNRVRPALRRRQGIGAELLLIRALRELDGDLALPLDILTEQGGKPYLACGTPHFSLSHSGRFAACALSDKTVGLDIQLQSPCRESLVHRFFAPEEQRYVLASEDRDAAFTEIWSKKESRLKPWSFPPSRCLTGRKGSASGIPAWESCICPSASRKGIPARIV